MKQSTIHCLERFKIAVATVAYMLTSIEALDEHELFLMDNHEKIHSCRQHWELFGFLNFYWNYLAYDLLHQLLEVLTRKESLFSVELQKMQEYQSEIEEFRGSTTLELFCKAQPHIVADPPPDFRKMVTEHNWPATVTLEHVELFRRKLQQTYNLKKCALMVKSVKKGSFTVTWFVHVSGVDMLKKTMTLHLIDEFEVTRLEIDGACIHRQVSLFTLSFQSFIFLFCRRPSTLHSSPEMKPVALLLICHSQFICSFVKPNILWRNLFTGKIAWSKRAFYCCCVVYHTHTFGSCVLQASHATKSCIVYVGLKQ